MHTDVHIHFDFRGFSINFCKKVLERYRTVQTVGPAQYVYMWIFKCGRLIGNFVQRNTGSILMHLTQLYICPFSRQPYQPEQLPAQPQPLSWWNGHTG